MDGRIHNALLAEPGGLDTAEASAASLRACYNLELRRGDPGDVHGVGPSDRDASTATAGAPHASESLPVFPFAAALCGTVRMRPLMVADILPPGHSDDEATASESGGGDAFDRFLREHRALLVAFLARRVGDDDAQDIAQETLVRLMRYRAQPVEQLRPLMYRIAINVIHDRGRRDTTRQVFAHVSLDQDFIGLASLEPAHDQRIEHEQELALVRSAILQLPDRCRQVYLLNRIEGMSYSQIAQHCGISVKAVEKHIGKALGILRARLKQGGVDREDRS